MTRQSVIDLALSENIQVEEKRLDIDLVLAKIKAKEITEVFGCGTAAVIAPISSILDRGQKIEIDAANGGVLTQSIRKKLTEIQFGQSPDPFGWRVALTTQAS